MESEEITIDLSKDKIILQILGCAVFVALGAWFILDPPKGNHPIFNNPTLLLVTGWAGIVFFGGIGCFLLYKITDKAPGLTISASGVTDNSSGVAAGFVPWADIIEVSEATVANQRFVNLLVRNPQEYIDRQTNGFKRKLLRINYSSYGSVISISANSLSGTHEEIKRLLTQAFAVHGQATR